MPQVWTALEESKNLSLQALYCLSRDFYDGAFHTVAAPDARALRDLRNHLEHKFLKVVDLLPSDQGHDIYQDSLSRKMTTMELAESAERTLKNSRSALVYLALAMHRHEEQHPYDGKLRFPLTVDDTPDDFKR